MAVQQRTQNKMPFSASLNFHTASPHFNSTKTRYFLPVCTSVSSGYSQISNMPPIYYSMESKTLYIAWDLLGHLTLYLNYLCNMHNKKFVSKSLLYEGVVFGVDQIMGARG